MAFRKSVLRNGATLVTDDMPGVRSITLGFWFNVGSRDEHPDQAGLTHFMEHMMFKGTHARTAAQISEEFDMIGAESNAFTSKECTCYHARFVDERLDEALSLLADMVVHSAFRDGDINLEREVVLEEIAQAEDEPEDYVFDLFTKQIWPTHPLGGPVLGTRDLVSMFRRPQCRAFHDEHYHSGNLVVSAAGNVDHDYLARKLEEALSAMRVGRKRRRVAVEELCRRDFAAQTRETEQAHLVYGFPWHAAGAQERFAGTVLTSILGGSASSRLFQEVREKNGLAYSVFAESSVYSDAGEFYVYCATRPDNLGKAARIIRRELARMADQAPSAREVKRSCEVLCGQLLMAMESTNSRMARIGRRETAGQDQLTEAQLVERYRAVTPADVQDAARKYLTATPTAAVVSPFGAEAARAMVLG